MVENIFITLQKLDNFFWSYVGFLLITIAGTFLTIKSRGAQFKALKNFFGNIKEIIAENKENNAGPGVNPLKLYFTSVGGMVGMGNIVLITSAVVVGGPGSIFWMWVASILGMLFKYSEIFLGVKYRIKNKENGYDGGPMHYLQAAFKSHIPAYLAAFLLCIYGVEVYQFVVLVDTMESTFNLDRVMLIIALMFLIFYTVLGGISRLSNMCSAIMPIFMVVYFLVCLYILLVNASKVPYVFSLIIKSAFTGHAPVGVFAGSTMISSAYMGISKAVYSGDIGIGYDAVVQSETRVSSPKKQARISIYALFTDTFICTLTTLIVLVSGSWSQLGNLEPVEIISAILADYIPMARYFLAILLFFAGFTTIVAFFSVGIKCASFLSKSYGKYIYMIYALLAFIYFSKFDQQKVILVMSLSGGALIFINALGILKLRNKIDF